MEDLLWGIWNGFSSLPLLILHVFDRYEQYPVYNLARDGELYQAGFILGVAILGYLISEFT